MTSLIKYKVTPSFEKQHLLQIDLASEETTLKVVIGGNTFSPSTTISTKMLEDDKQDVLNKLNDIKLCAIPQFATGLDGTSYKLEIQNGLNSAVYRWWSDLPKNWVVLKPLINKLETLLVQHLKYRGDKTDIGPG